MASTIARQDDLQDAFAKQTIITWMTAMLLAQGTLVVTLIQYLE